MNSKRRLYDDNLYQFDKPQPSYWEATAGETAVDSTPLGDADSCDVAIIGGGYTGLSAALHLARDYGVDVRVLEAGQFGWGASGRNGGFCGIGATGMSRSDFVRRHGVETARDFYAAQRDAVELVRQVAADENLDIEATGDAELEVAHSPRVFARMQAEHELLATTLGLDVRLIGAEEFRERYYDSTEQFGALRLRPTFGLHPLRYCRGLAGAAAARGAILHERSEVLEWGKTSSGLHRLRTAGGALTARRVIFATNGFTPENLRRDFFARTLPVISAIIVTRPLTEAELSLQRWHNHQPTINAKRVLNYFRLLPGNRLLFGGRGHTRGDVEGEQRCYEALAAALARIWPAWVNVGVEYRWHGLICFTGSLLPALGQLEDDGSVYFGFGYHGNGVNTATWSGKQLADWIGRGRRPRLPSVIDGMSRRFPLASLRLRYLQISIAFSSWLDRRD